MSASESIVFLAGRARPCLNRRALGRPRGSHELHRGRDHVGGVAAAGPPRRRRASACGRPTPRSCSRRTRARAQRREPVPGIAGREGVADADRHGLRPCQRWVVPSTSLAMKRRSTASSKSRMRSIARDSRSSSGVLRARRLDPERWSCTVRGCIAWWTSCSLSGLPASGAAGELDEPRHVRARPAQGGVDPRPPRGGGRSERRTPGRARRRAPLDRLPVAHEHAGARLRHARRAPRVPTGWGSRCCGSAAPSPRASTSVRRRCRR